MAALALGVMGVMGAMLSITGTLESLRIPSASA